MSSAHVSYCYPSLNLFVLALVLCIVMFIWVWTSSSPLWPVCALKHDDTNFKGIVHGSSSFLMLCRSDTLVAK